MVETEEVDLQLVSVIGFDGKTKNGLHVHPDGKHFVYSFGSSITIVETRTGKQEFLTGHTNLISTLALSHTGKYIASGQINYMGFKAQVIIWDFEERKRVTDYLVHLVRVEHLTFSANDDFLISLGGRDDSNIIVYDIHNRKPVSGAVANGANTGLANTLTATKTSGNGFLSGGDRTLRLWRIHPTQRKLTHMEIKFNKIKRVINCIVVEDKDELAYCGTTSGDILKVYLGTNVNDEVIANTNNFRPPVVIGAYGKVIEGKKKPGKITDCYSQGVTGIVMIDKDRLVIGTGDGTVEELVELDSVVLPALPNSRVREPTLPKFKKVRSHFVESGVTSMKLTAGRRLIIATMESEVYSIGLDKWDIKLLTTCHTDTIYDVAFPSDMSSVVATCSKDTVRVWNVERNQELLRIRVANMTCTTVVFQTDGRGIVTSWNDGKIRAFTPQTGQLMYIIHNAHNKGVTAMALTKDDKTIVSGGGEGQVRIWKITAIKQNLESVLQEHKGPVSAIHINNANDEAASASTDGSVIIWDLLRCARKNIIFANTLFMAVRFHTSDCQIVTAGTDRKIAYWETFDGSLIRDMEGSAAGAVNALDISPCGNYFVTGGNDQIIKLWRYNEGEVTHLGQGHAGIITKTKFSPDGKYIVSVSSAGAMFRWINPYFSQQPETPQPEPEMKEAETVRSEPGDKVSTSSSRSRESVKPCSCCKLYNCKKQNSR